MTDYVSRLPCRGRALAGDAIEIDVVEIRGLGSPLCLTWQREVQPLIDRGPARADVRWDWVVEIPALVFYGGRRRSPRMFQITVGPDNRPAAMIALLENERWLNAGEPAVYLWYIATAPRRALSVATVGGAIGVPALLGQAALDVALAVSLAGPAAGRLWLHADPAGGRDLLSWYGLDAIMTRIPPETFPVLPGDVIRGGRQNDGRYFGFTRETALWARDRLAAWRR